MTKHWKENEKLIIEYFKSVYYASTVASQNIFGHTGYREKRNFSMLYIRGSLNFCSGIQRRSTFPAMESYKDIYIEPTHVKTSYGHNVSTIDSYPPSGTGIYSLAPNFRSFQQGQNQLLILQLIFPISFITDNCRVVYNQSEAMYVVDENNIIVASAIRRPR